MYLSISKCLECGRCDQIEALASIIFLASYTYSWFCNRSRGMLESMGRLGSEKHRKGNKWGL